MAPPKPDPNQMLIRFLERAKSKHGDRFDYSQTEYKGCRITTTIGCPIHGWIQVGPWLHLKSRTGCQQCSTEQKISTGSKPVGLEEFIRRSSPLHDNMVDYSKTIYTRGVDQAIFICTKHNEEYKQILAEHLRGRTGCSGCISDKCRANNPSKSKEQFIKDAIAKHGNVYDYSLVEYKTVWDKIAIICEAYGEFQVSPHQHLRNQQNHGGCVQCIYDSLRKPLEKFIEDAVKVHGKLYDYSLVEYETTNTKVSVICPKHGTFTITPYSHINGSGCRKCTSNVSHIGNEWLNISGVPDTEECREVVIRIGERKFQADGFDPKTNTWYEFLGSFWHGDLSVYGSDEYNSLCHQTFGQLHDFWLEKKRLILEAGYNLIYIWESEWKAWKEYIDFNDLTDDDPFSCWVEKTAKRSKKT